MRKTLCAVALIAGLLSASRTSPAASPGTAVITGSSAKVRLMTADVQARWVQFVAPSGNSGTCRVGDFTITSSVGLPLEKGAGFMMPPTGETYSLNTIYVYVTTGDTLSVTWATPGP